MWNISPSHLSEKKKYALQTLSHEQSEALCIIREKLIESAVARAEYIRKNKGTTKGDRALYAYRNQKIIHVVYSYTPPKEYRIALESVTEEQYRAVLDVLRIAIAVAVKPILCGF
jgi:acyl-CoA synthetase (AMP-forming)/AMP-acid ligase II